MKTSKPYQSHIKAMSKPCQSHGDERSYQSHCKVTAKPLQSRWEVWSCILVLVFMAAMPRLTAQETVHLYPDSKNRSERKVTLECYPVENPIATVVVCPGGSYCWLDYEGEGQEVARWLQSQGFSAYVLRYRVAGWWAWALHYRTICRGRQQPDMFNDAHAALRWLNDHAKEYNIDTKRIGMMGFSAGGHLVMTMGCFEREYKLLFVAPIYPVVTMTEDCVHRRSRRGLLGDKGWRDERLRDSLSLERHVPTDCPPVFVVNCVDDPVVDYRNSMLLDSALTAQGVRHKYIQYKTGGHGFGVNPNKGTAECRPWKEEFLKWFNAIK